MSLIRDENSGGIMMLTARGDECDQVVGLDLGADGYLPKPVQPRLLLARLNALIDEPSHRLKYFLSNLRRIVFLQVFL